MGGDSPLSPVGTGGRGLPTQLGRDVEGEDAGSCLQVDGVRLRQVVEEPEGSTAGVDGHLLPAQLGGGAVE